MYILSLFLKQQVGNYFLCNVISYYLSHPIQKIRFFVRHCQNLRIFSCVNGFVKTKRQANFKGFKRFGAFKGLVEQKNVVFNSFVKLLFFAYKQ
ncbi:unnamed protein product [Tenebrio molitor]|nr:unnamed protein product [Tenebrio molitor]